MEKQIFPCIALIGKIIFKINYDFLWCCNLERIIAIYRLCESINWDKTKIDICLNVWFSSGRLLSKFDMKQCLKLFLVLICICIKWIYASKLGTRFNEIIEFQNKKVSKYKYGKNKCYTKYIIYKFQVH